MSIFTNISKILSNNAKPSHRALTPDSISLPTNRDFNITDDYINPDAWNRGFWDNVRLDNVTDGLKDIADLGKLKNEVTSMYAGPDKGILEYFRDVVYVIHKHSKSALEGAGKADLRQSYDLFLKEVNKKVEFFEKQISDSLAGIDIDIDNLDKMIEVSQTLTPDVMKNIDTLMNLRRTVASSQLANGFKSTTHDFATKELMEHMTAGRSRMASYAFFENMLDLDAIMDTDSSMAEMIGDILASKPNGSNTTNFINFFRESFGLAPIRKISDGEFKVDPRPTPASQLRPSQTKIARKIAADAREERRLTLQENAQNHAFSKAPKESVLSEYNVLLIKSGAALGVTGGVALFIWQMNEKYQDRMDAKRDECVAVCEPTEFSWQQRGNGVTWSNWTRDQDTAVWNSFILQAATMEPDDPYKPGRHPYCTTNNLNTYRTLENQSEALCEDYCNHNCDTLIVKKGWTNWLGENAETIVKSAAQLAGESVGTVVAAGVGAGAEAASAAGQSFWGAFGVGQWFAAGAAIILLFVLFTMLK